MKCFFSTVMFAAATRTASGFLVQPTAKPGLTATVDAQPTQKVNIASAASYRYGNTIDQVPSSSTTVLASAVIGVSEGATRDIGSLPEWASNCGVQTSDCFQLVASEEDGLDNVYAITNRDCPNESPLLSIPNELMLTGSKAREEFGGEAATAEQMLLGFYGADEVWQFYLFLKLLKEYARGESSQWGPWLNSLPRYFSNGASMTDFCYGCLPPYAAGLALAERTRMQLFVQALSEIPSITIPSENEEVVTQWAFSVVNSRCFPMPNGDFSIVPMADYFNHGGQPYEINVDLSYDDQGNCFVSSIQDIPAGTPLRISYGDSTNPSKLLARYGFLDDSSPVTYCKYIVDGPSEEVKNLGYPEKMLFSCEDGEISNEVWNVLLYEQLGSTGAAEQQQVFYQALLSGDDASTQAFHQQLFPETLRALQLHVEFLVNELEELEIGIEMQVTRGTHASRHPRLPLLRKHNAFVKKTFDLVQQNLDRMSQ
jgi:hypothetical protein